MIDTTTLNMLKKVNYQAYIYALLLNSFEYSFLNNLIADALEKQLYKIILSHLESSYVERIRSLKIEEITLMNEIFAEKKFYKMPHQEGDNLKEVAFCSNLELDANTDGYHTILKTDEGFSAENTFFDANANYLLNYYESDLAKLNNIMNELNNVFLDQQFDSVNPSDKEFIVALFNILNQIDDKRLVPNLNLQHFLKNYSLPKKKVRSKL